MAAFHGHLPGADFEAALRIYRAETGHDEPMALYLRNETILITRRAGKREATERIEHGLGRVPIVMAFNQAPPMMCGRVKPSSRT